MTKESVQQWASSNSEKEDLVKLGTKQKFGEHRVQVSLTFVATKPFFPPLLCLEPNKELPQEQFPNVKQNLHKLAPSITGYKEPSLPGPKLLGGSRLLS